PTSSSVLDHHTLTTQIHTLSLHDALPIYDDRIAKIDLAPQAIGQATILKHLQQKLDDIRMGFFDFVKQDHRIRLAADGFGQLPRSEEHTSELQSRENLVCRLLLEKKKE